MAKTRSHEDQAKKSSTHTSSHAEQAGSMSSAPSAESSTTHKTRGGTHEQHVKAGHAGGSAAHKCRGRGCK